MANWNDIKSGFTKAAKKTVKKTEEVAESATMYVKFSALKTRRDEAYQKLGRLTYRQIKTGESNAEAIAKLVTDLDKIIAEVLAQKAKIDAAKAEKERKKEEKRLAKEEADRREEEAIIHEVKVVVENTPMGEPVNFEEQ